MEETPKGGAMIQSVFVVCCPVCHSVIVLSAESFLEVLTNPKKVFVCSQECLSLLCKFTPATLD